MAKDKKGQLAVLKKLLCRKDLEYVVNARDAGASMEIGRVRHTKEQEQRHKDEYQTLFDILMQKQDSVSNIFSSLQDTLVNYASGGNKNSNVLAMLNSRNFAAIHNMSDYWSRLLG